MNTKRDAAFTVKRLIGQASSALEDAQILAAETGDSSLQKKVAHLSKETHQLQIELGNKLNSHSG